MKSKKGLKIIVGIVAGIIILLILATLVVKIVFTKEKLLSLLVPKVESALKRKVEIEDINVSIWGGLGVDVKGMKVLNPSGFTQEELFKFDQLSVRVKFLPLLRKRIEIKKLILNNPEIYLEKNQGGTSNIEDLTKSEGGKVLIPVAFDQLEIRNGTILYLDSKDQKKIVLHKFEENARLSLDEKMENAKATGKITVDQIELSLPNYKGTLPPLTFSLEHDINLNMPQDRLDIASLKIGIAKISMDVKGTVEKLSTIPSLNLSIQSNEIPLSDLLASLPKAESSPLNKLTTSGSLKISSSFQGEMKGEFPPQIQGKITFQNVKIDFVRVPQPFSMPYGEINFNNRSLNFFTSQAKLGEAPMELKLVVDNFSDPNVTSELKAKLNLAVLGEFVRMPENTSLAGEADVNIKAYGKIKKPEGTVGPERMNFSGQMQLRKVEVSTPALGVPIQNLNADISFQKGDVDISSLSLSLGESSLNLQGKLYGAIPYYIFKDQKKPFLNFSLNSPLMDLDEIFPSEQQAEKNVEEKTTVADTIPLPISMQAVRFPFKKPSFEKSNSPIFLQN